MLACITRHRPRGCTEQMLNLDCTPHKELGAGALTLGQQAPILVNPDRIPLSGSGSRPAGEAWLQDDQLQGHRPH